MDLPFLIYFISHICAISVLLIGICKKKSCTGISGKSQLLYAIVFVTRYLHVVFPPIDVDFLFMPIFTATTSCIILYLIYDRFKDTYDRELDYCSTLHILIPCALLACLCHDFTYHRYGRDIEIVLAFSLYLESVAILPQLLLTLRTGFTNGYVLSYIFILASNSELQILYWIYDYYYEDRYYINDLVIAPTGMVQAMVYVAFYCVHFSRAHEVPYKVDNI